MKFNKMYFYIFSVVFIITVFILIAVFTSFV